MSTYLDRYVKGSFDSVPFLTESATTTFGRRVAAYELPFDNSGVAHVDLGRSARKFKIKAILLGANYDRDRDKLVKSLEKSGAKLLVHPYLGRHMVIVHDDIQITESTDNGGCAEIEFACIEARDPVPDPPGGSLLDKINAARDAASDNLFVKLLTEGPDFLTEDVFATLDSVARTLTVLNAQIGAWLAAPGQLAAKINRISQQLASLIDTPRKLFDAIDGFIQSLIASISRVIDAADQEDVPDSVRHSALLRAIKRLGELGDDLPEIPDNDTVARERQRVNRAAILQSMKASAFANSAQGFAELAPASNGERKKISDELIAQILELAEGNMRGVEVSENMHATLKDMASEVARLADPVQDQGFTQYVTTSDGTSIEVLAFQLYGDPERAQEILDANPTILHPGAIPAGYRLEVKSR